MVAGFLRVLQRCQSGCAGGWGSLTGTQQVLKYTDGEARNCLSVRFGERPLNSADSGFAVQIGKEQAAVVDTFPPNQYATF